MKLFPIKESIKKSKIQNIHGFKKIIKSGKFILDKNVENLEKKLKKIIDSKYCISTSSGTDALLISLMAIDLKPNDEVITTAFTYIATAEVIIRLGAKPIFVNQVLNDGQLSKKMYLTNYIIREFSLKNNHRFIDLAKSVVLDKKDFYDEFHTTPSGSKKIAEYLYPKLKNYFE